MPRNAWKGKAFECWKDEVDGFPGVWWTEFEGAKESRVRGVGYEAGDTGIIVVLLQCATDPCSIYCVAARFGDSIVIS